MVYHLKVLAFVQLWPLKSISNSISFFLFSNLNILLNNPDDTDFSICFTNDSSFWLNIYNGHERN